MPNDRDPNKRQHNFWIDDELWIAASTKAKGRGETLTDVVRRALERYVKSK